MMVMNHEYSVTSSSSSICSPWWRPTARLRMRILATHT